MKLVHRGSTKDVYSSGDHYVFRFSDRYSVFDWGEMPDHLKDKGQSLARFTKTIYRRLEAKGIRTHFVDVPCAENEMVIRPFEVNRAVPLPQKENIFIPLEVIFRLGVARGSSLLGRSEGFEELQRFDQPMIEFTTKLERFDRRLSSEEARLLTGMNDTEWFNLFRTTSRIARELGELFDEEGVELWDGKLEFALGERVDGNREIILVDSIGPDELRLTKGDLLLSKELIRQYYRKSSWYENLESVKEKFGTEFKDHIPAPERLPARFHRSVEAMYALLPDLIGHVPGTGSRLDALVADLRGAGP